MKDLLRTRDAVSRAYGQTARVISSSPGQRCEHVLYEIRGLAIIVHYHDERVERAFVTNSDDELDEETLRRCPWTLEEVYREFEVSRGIARETDN